MKYSPVKNIFLCLSLLVYQMASAQVFTVQTRESLPYHVPNNATFFQSPLTGTKVQKDFDILNTTNTYHDIIVRKSELLLNVLNANDKALASYCFGINCHGAEVFADTVSFLPYQSVALEIDFIEASAPGHSLIRYTVQDKNNPSDNLFIFMDYSGVLGIPYQTKKDHYLLYPNPASQIIYLVPSVESKNEKTIGYQFYNMQGELCLDNAVTANNSGVAAIALEQLSKGLYYFVWQDQSGFRYREKILVH